IRDMTQSDWLFPLDFYSMHLLLIHEYCHMRNCYSRFPQCFLLFLASTFVFFASLITEVYSLVGLNIDIIYKSQRGKWYAVVGSRRLKFRIILASLFNAVKDVCSCCLTSLNNNVTQDSLAKYHTTAFTLFIMESEIAKLKRTIATLTSMVKDTSSKPFTVAFDRNLGLVLLSSLGPFHFSVELVIWPCLGLIIHISLVLFCHTDIVVLKWCAHMDLCPPLPHLQFDYTLNVFKKTLSLGTFTTAITFILFYELLPIEMDGPPPEVASMHTKLLVNCDMSIQIYYIC
ncbi:hypothetical protein ACJX0J_007430, partial [Zea mays]